MGTGKRASDPFKTAICHCQRSSGIQRNKDNVIHFKGSSYSVPDGTFQKPKTEVFVRQQNDCLIISNIDHEEIARHEISLLKASKFETTTINAIIAKR